MKQEHFSEIGRRRPMKLMEEHQNLTILERPQLRRPVMICGIGGWVDGGEAATGSVRYLLRKLKAKEFANIPLDHFHVYQMPGEISSRPHVKLEDGILKVHRFPRNRFFYWTDPVADNDLILFNGTEPNMHWEEYAEAILKVAKEFDVSRLYLLGGVLDTTPHTREPNVSCSFSLPELMAEMSGYGVRFNSYEGPGRFGTTLLYICQQRQIEMVSLTVRTTYYPENSIIIPRNPKAIRALVRRLRKMVGLDFSISDLDGETEKFEQKLAAMAKHNPEFRDYVESLENDYSELGYEEPLDLSGDEAIHIAEELLKGNAGE